MKKCKFSYRSCAAMLVCLLISTMFIVPTTSAKYDSGTETTFHTITVNVVDGKVAISIKPLASEAQCENNGGCEVDGGCPVENRTCCSGEAVSFERVVLERGENYAVTLFSIENGENRFEATITRTRLWSYVETKKKANATFSFTETSTVVSEDLTASSRELAYIIQYPEYTVRGVSLLSPSQSSASYETCFSIMNYIPADKTEILSMEIVQFNVSVTLSQHYAFLGEVAKEMRKLYKHSQNQTFNELVGAYHAMEKEAKQISKLIEKQLPNYNHEILKSVAILRDPIGCDPACCIAEDLMSLEVEPLCGGGGGGSPPPTPSTCNLLCIFNTLIACHSAFSGLSFACMAVCFYGSLACLWFMPACFAKCLATICLAIDVATIVGCVIYAVGVCCF